jgi:hypothetical protein
MSQRSTARLILRTAACVAVGLGVALTSYTCAAERDGESNAKATVLADATTGKTPATLAKSKSGHASGEKGQKSAAFLPSQPGPRTRLMHLSSPGWKRKASAPTRRRTNARCCAA